MTYPGGVPSTDPSRPAAGVAFLLAQLGSDVAHRFAERVEPLGLAPGHAGCLRILATSAPMNQKQLAQRLGTVPSRVVVLIDSLEAMGLVERRRSATDRRSYDIVCTPKGESVFRELREVSRLHELEFTGALTRDEAAELGRLLTLVAQRRGLLPGVHPDYRGAGGDRPRPQRRRPAG